MPFKDEIKYGRDINKTGLGQSFIWAACIDCGKERWVRLVGGRNGQPMSLRCYKCSAQHNKKTGKNNHNWRGGKTHHQGYVRVKLYPDDFYYPMAQQSSDTAFEHRLVMAKYLGRCLHSWEIVHHKNHIRDDNRLENLQLVSDDRHRQITILEVRISYLEKRVNLLEAENILLRGYLDKRQGVTDFIQGGE